MESAILQQPPIGGATAQRHRTAHAAYHREPAFIQPAT